MKLFSTRQAAEYLGISLSTMKKYIHVKGRLRGQKIGHDLVFTQEELDEFDRNRRPVGRPRSSEDVVES